jgi:hypothetical protein
MFLSVMSRTIRFDESLGTLHAACPGPKPVGSGPSADGFEWAAVIPAHLNFGK